MAAIKEFWPKWLVYLVSITTTEQSRFKSLDFGLCSFIESLQHKASPNTVDELIECVEKRELIKLPAI